LLIKFACKVFSRKFLSSQKAVSRLAIKDKTLLKDKTSIQCGSAVIACSFISVIGVLHYFKMLVWPSFLKMKGI